MYLELVLKMPCLLRVVILDGEGGFGDKGRFKEESGLKDKVYDGLREAGSSGRKIGARGWLTRLGPVF